MILKGLLIFCAVFTRSFLATLEIRAIGRDKTKSAMIFAGMNSTVHFATTILIIVEPERLLLYPFYVLGDILATGLASKVARRYS